MSQNTSKGEVISVFAFGENSYSFIHEKGTGHYYKTSIHNTGELNQGQFVELLFDQVDNISNSVQVNALTLTNSLFCQRISEEEIGNEKGEDRNKIDYRKYVSYNAKHDVLVFETWDGGCVSISEFLEFTLYTPVPEAEGCDQNHKVKDTYSAEYQGNNYRLKIVDHARGSWGTQSWRKIHGQQILYRKKPGQWFWHTYSAWHEIHRTGYFYEVVDKNCETGYNLVDNGPFKSCYGERYQWISPGLSFPNQFGLDEGSVMFNHKVYIWGAMVTKDDWTDPNPSEQDFYNCHNPWGHLLFDRNVWVGQP